uniref:Uncharacterized protein n=1 Tax=Globisporangium ultimum (strain ATCC 200006 / CBS 805.95 / DAOM BR144) TaxID=431595 RepID=K3WS43_GLOUD
MTAVDTNVKVYVGCTAALYLKLFTDEKDEQILKASEVELRWHRVILNDLESIAFALLVFGSGILVGSNQTVNSVALSAWNKFM